MILAEPAVLLGHREGEEAVLSQELQVPPREHQLVVEALRVGPELLLAQLDQGGPELFLPLRVHPVRVPFVSETPERLGSPLLVSHVTSRRVRPDAW